ncbi:MAG: hypothetical protein IJ412_03015 [Oscillospiraceae bacterium]|nr:hypothetical protein [Oscillospiraceae bacterium]
MIFGIGIPPLREQKFQMVYERVHNNFIQHKSGIVKSLSNLLAMLLWENIYVIAYEKKGERQL